MTTAIAADELLTRTHDPASVDAAYRRLSRRIVPILFLSYVVVYMDAYNIGFAQLQMKGHIGLSDTMYGVGASLLVVGQLLFMLPSNLLLQRIGARATILRIMLCWGVGSLAMAFITTPAQFVVLRFVTGILTTGFFTGLILYLTFWYPSGRRARMMSVFMLAPVAAGVLVGPLSGWIIGTLHQYAGLQGWQWMFIIESLPCFVVSALVYPLLADRPEKARWLTPRDREIVAHNLLADQSAMPAERLTSLREVLANPRVYLLGLAGALVTFGMLGMAFFMPTIIRDLGVSDVRRVGLLSAIPYVVGGVAMVLYSRHSDRTLERRWHMAGAMATAAAGFVVLAGNSSVVGGVVGLVLVVGGLLSGPPVFWPIPAAFMSGTGAAAGIAVIMIICELGGALAPPILGYIRTSTGSLEVAIYAIALLLLLGAALLLAVVPRRLLHERRPD